MRTDIKRIIACLVSLLVPALGRADLANTAWVSYKDGPYMRTAPSNTVTVAVSASANPLLQPPAIKGFNPFNRYLSLSDTLSVVLEGGAADRLEWVFTPGAPDAASPSPLPPVASSKAKAAGYAVSTPAPSLSLNTVPQLTAGSWHVSVTAFNGAGVSAPAEGDFFLALSDLGAARVYPNPWRQGRHDGVPITFDRLSLNTRVKIFTISGRLVKDLGTANDSVSWNLANDSGDKAASGLYLYVLTDDQGHKARGRLAVIR